MKIAAILRGAPLLVMLGSRGATGTEPSDGATRTCRTGFSSLPPRLTIPEVLQTVDSITKHGDAALMVVDVPWAALLADSNPSLLIRRDQYPLALPGLVDVNYRAKSALAVRDGVRARAVVQ